VICRRHLKAREGKKARGIDFDFCTPYSSCPELDSFDNKTHEFLSGAIADLRN